MKTPVASWVTTLRAQGAGAFAAAGLPRADQDGWRHTPLPPDLMTRFGAGVAPLDVTYAGPEGLVHKLMDCYTGAVPALEWLEGLQSRPARGPLWALANAHLRDGVAVDIPEGAALDVPLVLTLTGHDGQFLMTRTAIHLGPGARATIIEHHRGAGSYWNNRLSQIVVGQGAHLTHIRFQGNSTDAVYTQTTAVEVSGGGTYEAFNFVTGAALSRLELHVDLLAPGAAARAHGLSLLRGSQLADHTTTIAHRARGCESAQHLGFILDRAARGVYQGRVRVEPGADGTDAQQRSRAVLLSDQARMATQPELEIFADDVQCAHGATCGALEGSALFYLRARGVPEAQARALLLQGFAAEVLAEVADADTRAAMEERVTTWLSAA